MELVEESTSLLQDESTRSSIQQNFKNRIQRILNIPNAHFGISIVFLLVILILVIFLCIVGGLN